MTVVLFIVMLLLLVIGHEFGHFVVAKISKMDVPEFGVGFPPKLWGKKIGETEYTINALPFGGFVKIIGEDPPTDAEERISGRENSADNPRAFYNRPFIAKAGTLIAGPFSNILIAFLLSTAAFMIGIPAASDSGFGSTQVQNAHVLIVDVVHGSPSEKAGLKQGDELVSVTTNGQVHSITSPEDISAFVQSSTGPVVLALIRSGKPLSVSLTPVPGIVTNAPTKKAIGIASAEVGTLKLSFFSAVRAGYDETLQNVKNIFVGIISLIGHALTFSANLSSVAGPVGIATLVGDAAAFGFGSVLSFAALISVNLGIINFLPFPALDGGRLTILLAETVSGKRVPAKVANAINTVGFALLILLMIAITAHDIFRVVT